ncbi:MAG: hypothetical protein ACJ77K_06695 [Bacteroidia bacterium]
MNPILSFWIVFAILAAAMLFATVKYGMLNDSSILVSNKPYSFSRTQLAWWTLIILSAFTAIILSARNENHDIPVFSIRVVILLGISAGTLASARITELGEQRSSTAPPASFIQNQNSESFLLDILSDKDGVSIHRLQALIFNLVLGCWFIYKVLHALPVTSGPGSIMPELNDNDLILLGISSGTYVALKTGENKKY